MWLLVLARVITYLGGLARIDPFVDVRQSMNIAPDDLSELEGHWMHVTHVTALYGGIALEGAGPESQSYAHPWRLKECIFFRQHGLVLVFDRGLQALGELVLQWRHVLELVPVSTDVLARLERRVYEG